MPGRHIGATADGGTSRQGLQAFPTPSSSHPALDCLAGCCLKGSQQGAAPQGIWRERGGCLPRTAGLPARSALVCTPVLVVSSCLFLCAAALSPSSHILCTPQFPSSRHPSSSQELEKPLSGARPLPHPPTQGVCPAPPSSSLCMSRWPGRPAGRGVGKGWRRRPFPLSSRHPSPGAYHADPGLGTLSLLTETLA